MSISSGDVTEYGIYNLFPIQENGAWTVMVKRRDGARMDCHGIDSANFTTADPHRTKEAALKVAISLIDNGHIK